MDTNREMKFLCNILFLNLFVIHLHINTSWALERRAEIDYALIVVFKLHRHGLGSNLINLLAFKKHVESKNNKFIIDESSYYYKYKNEGVMTSFFRPTTLILKDKNELQNFTQNNKGVAVITTQTGNGINRQKISDTYPRRGLPYYEWITKEACSTLKFSNVGVQRMNELKVKNNIPSFLNSVSVGFHVRRGDKLNNGKSSKFDGSEYVDILLSITTENIENCFIASDDFQGVRDVKIALKRGKVHCKVYSLVKHNQKGSSQGSRSDEEVLQFITEFSILTETKYFIGSFNSNVGGLVSIMRSCGKKDKSNYSQSYSVSAQKYPYLR